MPSNETKPSHLGLILTCLSDETPLSASSSIVWIVSGRESDSTQESVNAPPPRKGFHGSHRVGICTTNHLGGDGNVFEIGSVDANKSD